jgi:LCP family protein required for cell wall assembly
MAAPTRRRLLAATLSMLAPGAGQLYVGVRRRGLVLLALAVVGVPAVLLAATRVTTIDRRVLAGVLAADAALLALRLFAVVDAWRAGSGRATRAALAALAVLVGATAVPHVAAAYVAVRGYSTLETVFAASEPVDILPSYGLFIKLEPPRELEAPLLLKQNASRASEPLPGAWTTLLLAGTDEGPGNWGARTDTMIVVALHHGTPRAVAFGVPRNLVGVPLDGTKRFRQPLNALYGREGPSVLKQTISRLLGIRVDYYAVVSLLGFADLVDALGGVTIHVKERLVDSVTRPAWGEPKPRIDVHRGETVHMGGRVALAYVRSRKTSSDYTRMARQRCFLSAMAHQLDPYRVLRNFGKLTRTVERNVRTDIPLAQLPSLVRLVSRVDSRLLLTETFGSEYIARRRKADSFPVPDVWRMRATVTRALVDPVGAQAAGTVEVAAKTC